MSQPTYDRTYIREWRLHRNLTQEQLAKLAGFDAAYISLLERGVRGYSQQSLQRIAKALKCTPGELTDIDPSWGDGSLRSLWADLSSAKRKTAMDMLKLLVRA